MRNIVTGGAGFVGHHLVRAFLERGDEVVVVDDISSGSVDNIPARAEFCQTDISDDDFFYDIDSPVDRIYHLACPASPATYGVDPVKTLRTCFEGTRRVLEAAKSYSQAQKHKVRVLFTSTSEVFGDPLEHPQRETYRGNVDCTSPRSCYDEGKRVAETLCYSYARHHGVEVRVARIFNTYGPGMGIADGRIVSNFIVQALHGEPLTVYGDGTQTRSLCYIDDTVDGLLKLMESDVREPVNIGNPDERTVLDIADAIAKAVGGEHPRAEFKPLPVDDPRQRCPDIARARTALGWSPVVPLEEGLRRTVEDFRRRLAL